MPRLTADSVLEHFQDTIPDAHDQVEAYLRAVDGRIGAQRLPVTSDVSEVPVGGGLGAPRLLCLVLTPTERRLRRYLGYHYGAPMGTVLNVGWYLTGKTASGGLGRAGWAGEPSRFDLDELQALTVAIHTTAVLPAIEELARVAVRARRRRTGAGTALGHLPASRTREAGRRRILG